MNRFARLGELFKDRKTPVLGALDIFKYIGPGLLVTVGFIDPGNWASNVAAGANYGYALLWMVTLSTLMLIFLQHNAAHLGIASGLCLAEATERHLPKPLARPLLATAFLAALATALAEILGAAIALRMLFGLPLWTGALLTVLVVSWMLFGHSYKRLEKLIIGFVSLIGLGFIFELWLVPVDWRAAALGWVWPSLPEGSLPIVMSVLGAVVMPHNIFLHSEVIQSRQWHLENEAAIRRELRFEFLDTLFSMGVGFAINSAMILVAAATFFAAGQGVGELEQAQAMLGPLLGPAAAIVFAVALLLAGLASSLTAAMAGGTISAGLFGEPYDLDDWHSKAGAGLTLLGAFVAILLVSDPFSGLIYSQMALSVQLPLTIFLLLYLTSAKSVMGPWRNSRLDFVILLVIGLTVTGLNAALLQELFFG